MVESVINRNTRLFTVDSMGTKDDGEPTSFYTDTWPKPEFGVKSSLGQKIADFKDGLVKKALPLNSFNSIAEIGSVLFVVNPNENSMPIGFMAALGCGLFFKLHQINNQLRHF